jgi:putative membrane-bound dehydrogenase-like protein
MARMSRSAFYVAAMGVLVTFAGGVPADPIVGTADEKLDVPKQVEASAAIDTFSVPAGFRLELVAAEPLVHDPMAMEFDENGIAYVLEIPAYNEHGKPGPRTPGSIARLEDTDGDGRFDRRVTFAGDLKYPTGLFCCAGGLFVGDPPDLLYLRDTDGDGRADEREALFTGFGAALAGETQLNSFRWGLDNRIHICTGHDGGDIRPVNDPAAPVRSVRNRRILLDPRSRTFELTSGGGQHGMCFDDWGRVFVCENSHPIQQIFYDDRYIQRNPLMSALGASLNIGPGTNFAKIVRTSGPDAWRRIRKRLLREGAAITDTYEFDRIAGVFTSATGITIYRGDTWPEAFRGNAFVGDVANNLVYRARIKPDGLSTTSERADPETGFLASTDNWFRPVQFSQGPDGNLYVIDMYRQLIEGIQWVPPEVVAQMDPTAGNDLGRIYRLVPENFRQPAPYHLGQMTIDSLADVLEHPNGWRRDTAARLIYERQDERATTPLRRLLHGSTYPQARLHAMYALDGLGSLTAEDVLTGLADENPRVREHAVRLAEKFAANSTVERKLVEMVDDNDIAIRLQLAFSYGSLRPPARDPALVKLLHRDGENSWFRVAVQSSLGTGAADFVSRLLADSELRQAAHVKDFLATLSSQIGRSKHSQDLRVTVGAIDRLSGDDAGALAKNLVIALLDDGSGATTDELAESSSGRVKNIARSLLADAEATALDDKQTTDSRLEAITVLGCGTFSGQQTAFDELLAPHEPQPIQEAVVKILGRFSDTAVVELLLRKWSGLTPGLRSSAAEVLLARPEWAESLLSAVEKNEIPAGDFDPARVALLQSHPLAKVRKRAAAVFANSSVARRADVVARYQRSLELEGDVERGRAVFAKSCAACHKLEGKGTEVGADLGGVRQRGAAGVLLNILDPNREILPKFLTYAVVTSDGRIFTGLIAKETSNDLSIRQPDGHEVPIKRRDIEEMASTGLSYMPEGLESQIDHQAMADLIAYLMATPSTPQTPGTME